MRYLYLFIIVAHFFVACSGFNEDERLNRQALEEYNIPVRPGYEGKNPYWNEFAEKFLYAPAFDFKPVVGRSYINIV